MRNDLSLALTPITWAEAQILILQDRFLDWQKKKPYEIVVEPDPSDPKRKLIVAYLKTPLGPLIHGDVGCMINAIRTSLDLLITAVVDGNGIKNDREIQFPIRKHSSAFLDCVNKFEAKKWINSLEANYMKRAKAYDRRDNNTGDHVFYPLHKLDIMRKHERLLRIEPSISQANITAWGADIEPLLIHLDDKTVLFRMPKSRKFPPSTGNTFVTAEMFLNEPSIWVADQPAIAALRAFSTRVKEFIKSFP